MMEQFKFRNFEPTDEIRNFANHALNQILELVPSEAYLKASLAKVGDAFEGFIEVVSSVGSFNEKTVDQDPRGLVEKLTSQIREKIRRWHTNRFLSPRKLLS